MSPVRLAREHLSSGFFLCVSLPSTIPCPTQIFLKRKEAIMFLRKTEHDLTEKTYPHTEGDFSLKGLSFWEKLRKIRRDQRGVETGTIVWMSIGIAAAIGLSIWIFSLVSNTGSTIESASSSEVLTYSRTCNVSNINSVARVVATNPNNNLTAAPTGTGIVLTLSRTLDEGVENMELQHAGAYAINNDRARIDAQSGSIGTITVSENDTSATGVPALTTASTGNSALLKIEDLPGTFSRGTAGGGTNLFDSTDLSDTTVANGELANLNTFISELRSAVLAKNIAEGCWTLSK